MRTVKEVIMHRDLPSLLGRKAGDLQAQGDLDGARLLAMARQEIETLRAVEVDQNYMLVPRP